jgi:hypothetical protein
MRIFIAIVFLAPARQFVKDLSLMALFVLSLALTQTCFNVEFKVIVGTILLLITASAIFLYFFIAPNELPIGTRDLARSQFFLFLGGIMLAEI